MIYFRKRPESSLGMVQFRATSQPTVPLMRRLSRPITGRLGEGGCTVERPQRTAKKEIETLRACISRVGAANLRISESPDQIVVLHEAVEGARALTGEVLSLNQVVKSQIPRSSCGESAMGWTNHCPKKSWGGGV